MSNKGPKDQLGNTLSENDYVVLVTGQPLVFKVAAVQEGGLAVPNQAGTTPAAVRIVADMTIQVNPGGRINNLLRVVNPQSEDLLKKLLDTSQSS